MYLEVTHHWQMSASEIYSAMIVGARMRHIRDVFELSQQDIARMCGKTKSTVSNWEQGLQRPTIAQAMAIADELDLTLDYIYLGRTNTLRHDQAVKVSEKRSAESA